MTPYSPQLPEHDNGKLTWFSAIMRAIALLLLPSIVAGYLIYFLVTSVEARMMHIQETFRLHQIDTSYNIKANEEQNRINDQQTLQLQAMFRLLQQICVNTAQTSDDRAICWNPWR